MESEVQIDESDPINLSLNKIVDQYIREIEMKLRKEEAHWLRAGFTIPSEKFSFVMEILSNLQSELRLICDSLDDENFNVSSSSFLEELKTILDQVELRAYQIEELLDIKEKHELVLSLQEAVSLVLERTRKLRKSMLQAAITTITQPEKIGLIYSKRQTEICTLEISIEELQTYLGEVYAIANNGTVFASLV